MLEIAAAQVLHPLGWVCFLNTKETQRLHLNFSHLVVIPYPPRAHAHLPSVVFTTKVVTTKVFKRKQQQHFVPTGIDFGGASKLLVPGREDTSQLNITDHTTPEKEHNALRKSFRKTVKFTEPKQDSA